MHRLGSKPDGMSLSIYRQKSVVYSTNLNASLELGRQDQRRGEPEPYGWTTDSAKLVIAGYRELTISRHHAVLEPLPDASLRVRNCSSASVVLVEDIKLFPGDQRDVEVPVLLTLGDRVVRIENQALSSAPSSALVSLAQPTMAPGQSESSSARIVDLLSHRTGSADLEKILRWLQNTMVVFQSAASSSNFLAEAVRTVAENVNLDAAAVLIRDGDEWKTEALHVTGEAETYTFWKPSQTLLNQVRSEKRTFWQIPGGSVDRPESLVEVSAFVASPILDRECEVIGAMYGDRRRMDRFGGNLEITEMEALLVELLACGVAAGLARVEQEKEALAERVRFEQFFTAELAEQLESQPDLLVGKDAEVTVLFCDIRGFSAITEQLGAERTIEWINDALECLSACVIRHQGVLVDYVGDELMAMWGAPQPHEDHAERACRAAQDMIGELAILNERWEPVLGGPMGLGVGVNSGLAQVGNVGSRCKFKYGALGNVVNLGSRTQGATKHVKTNLLVTGFTAAKLGDGFHRRRLCSVRVVNIVEPVELYELGVNVTPQWQQLKHQYESALAAFEKGEFLAATRTLGNLVEQYPDDGPTLVLLSRTVRMLANPPDNFDPVWELSSK